jgi:HPt (histidine-containing phosphotransfer) domain-containing protein
MTPFDFDRLNDLCQGNIDEMREMLTLAITSGRSILDRLQAAREHSDLAEIREALHELHGSCSNVGARELASIAVDLTNDLRGGKIDNLSTEDVSHLEQAFRNLVRARATLRV